MNQSNGSSSMHGRQLNGVLSRGSAVMLNGGGISSGGLHEDVDFPPTPRTLTRKKNVIWMRPHVSGHIGHIYLLFKNHLLSFT
jgi:hypothetical protein